MKERHPRSVDGVSWVPNPATDHELVTKVNKAFTVTTRAGNAIIRTSVPPFTLWRRSPSA